MNVLDVRQIESRYKHVKIFDMFYSLDSGEKMEIINDHDPRPLHYQMLAENEGQFEWRYLEEGPEVWRVEITRK
ncbi:MAG: DUF2249 domain-containing protein [Gudongella sp.]|nr:DUF2249 domain-containing protein [Gudongella sp.]